MTKQINFNLMKKLKIAAGVALAPQKTISIPTINLEIPDEWNELFILPFKYNFMRVLEGQIKESGYYTPLTVFKFEEKYIIIDGVLRFKVLTDLGKDYIDCTVVDFEPKSSDDLKDRIIESQMKSYYDERDVRSMFIHYLRIGSTELLDDSKMNQRCIKLSHILGRGWGRSNVYHFKGLLEWELKNPDNPFKMSEKILDVNHSMTVNKSIDVRGFLTNEMRPYTLENEIESGILQSYVDGEIRFQKQLIALIEAYLNKAEDRFTQINVPAEITEDRYQILHCDSSKVVFPENTEIHGIFTSPPYYKQVRYSQPHDPEYSDELGWEVSAEEYVKKVVNVIRRGTEVMDDKGVIMINMNETFIKGECVGVIPLYITEMKKHFHYIQTCIWVKNDAKPNNEKVKRLTNTHEYIMIFSKTKKYNYNKFKLANLNKSASVNKNCSEQGKTIKNSSGFHITNPYDQCKDFMFENDFVDYLVLNKGSGRSQDEGLDEKFFGSFPTLLPVPFIMSFIPENGTVWDPFGGTGTTGRTVLSLNRKVIITELLGRNIPNIKTVLEKGISENNEHQYQQLKKDSLYEEGEIQIAA